MGLIPFWYFNVRWHVHMCDFITMIIAGYAGKHLKQDIEENYEKYSY